MDANVVTWRGMMTKVRPLPTGGLIFSDFALTAELKTWQRSWLLRLRSSMGSSGALIQRTSPGDDWLTCHQIRNECHIIPSMTFSKPYETSNN
jgi:hypothetical protein